MLYCETRILFIDFELASFYSMEEILATTVEPDAGDFVTADSKHPCAVYHKVKCFQFQEVINNIETYKGTQMLKEKLSLSVER